MVRPSNKSKRNVTRSILPPCSIHGIWLGRKTSCDGLANNNKNIRHSQTNLSPPALMKLEVKSGEMSCGFSTILIWRARWSATPPTPPCRSSSSSSSKLSVMVWRKPVEPGPYWLRWARRSSSCPYPPSMSTSETTDDLYYNGLTDKKYGWLLYVVDIVVLKFHLLS